MCWLSASPYLSRNPTSCPLNLPPPDPKVTAFWVIRDPVARYLDEHYRRLRCCKEMGGANRMPCMMDRSRSRGAIAHLLALAGEAPDSVRNPPVCLAAVEYAQILAQIHVAGRAPKLGQPFVPQDLACGTIARARHFAVAFRGTVSEVTTILGSILGMGMPRSMERHKYSPLPVAPPNDETFRALCNVSLPEYQAMDLPLPARCAELGVNPLPPLPQVVKRPAGTVAERRREAIWAERAARKTAMAEATLEEGVPV